MRSLRIFKNPGALLYKAHFWHSALHHCISENKPDRVAALLEAGDDPNRPNDYGSLPLQFSVVSNYTKCTVLLLKAGAKPDLPSIKKNGEKQWVMQNRIYAGDSQTIFLLVMHGASEEGVDYPPRCQAMKSVVAKAIALKKEFDQELKNAEQKKIDQPIVALRHYQAAGDIWYGLANMQGQVKDYQHYYYELALAEYLKAKTLYDAVSNKTLATPADHHVVQLFNTMADCYHRLGDAEKARSCATLAAKWCEKLTKAADDVPPIPLTVINNYPSPLIQTTETATLRQRRVPTTEQQPLLPRNGL